MKQRNYFISYAACGCALAGLHRLRGLAIAAWSSSLIVGAALAQEVSPPAKPAPIKQKLYYSNMPGAANPPVHKVESVIQRYEVSPLTQVRMPIYQLQQTEGKATTSDDLRLLNQANPLVSGTFAQQMLTQYAAVNRNWGTLSAAEKRAQSAQVHQWAERTLHSAEDTYDSVVKSDRPFEVQKAYYDLLQKVREAYSKLVNSINS